MTDVGLLTAEEIGVAVLKNLERIAEGGYSEETVRDFYGLGVAEFVMKRRADIKASLPKPVLLWQIHGLDFAGVVLYCISDENLSDRHAHRDELYTGWKIGDYVIEDPRNDVYHVKWLKYELR